MNNHTNSCHFFIKCLADGLVAHSSLAQVYSLALHILWQLFDVARGGGETGMEETDSVDRLGARILALL